MASILGAMIGTSRGALSMGRLANRVALITGGASGIGAAAARLFVAEGASVILADLDAEKGEALAVALGDKAAFLRLDVTDPAQWEAAAAHIRAAHGRLDVLVNSAGISLKGDLIDGPLDIWHRTMAVNATGTYLGCRTAMGLMKSAGNAGAIVNLCSIYGNIAAEDVIAYAASKGAVRQLTKAVAMSSAAQSLAVRCNSVHPAFVDSELLQDFAAAVGGHDAMVKALSSVMPMRRMARTEDVARAILFLSSDDAAMTTGAELAVDGGMLAGIVAPVTAPEPPEGR